MNDCISTLDTIGNQIRKLTGNSNLADADIDQMLMIDKARKRNRKRVAKNNRRKEKAMSLLAEQVDEVETDYAYISKHDTLYIDNLIENGYDIEIRSLLNQWHVVITYGKYSASVTSEHILDGVHTALDLIASTMIEADCE